MSSNNNNILEEFQSLISLICNSNISINIRNNSEKELTELIENKINWQELLSLLININNNNNNNNSLEENILFFTGQGLYSSVWKNWNLLSSDEQIYFTNCILQTLSRINISTFVRSKIEQVLAAICASSASLQPVLSIVVELNQPGFEIGLSALRTVFEEILKDDPRILPSQKLLLFQAATEVAIPLSNLICNIFECHTSTLSSNFIEKNALELFREIVLRLPVGPHLSINILNSLFCIVERQYRTEIQQNSQELKNIEENNALLAVEILCDVMSKKYIPRDNGNEDSGATVLVELIAQAIGLLQQMSTSNRNIEDITTALPLLEFINLFVEYHIERCISTSTRHSKTAAVMEVFLNELSNLTRQCTVPDYLHKLCLIWKGLFEDESAKAAVLNNENCLQAGFHIFQVGLFQYNSNLENYLDDIEDDIDTNPFNDEKIKNILFPVQRKGSENSTSRENNILSSHDREGSPAYNFLQIVTVCITSFSESTQFISYVGQISQSYLQTTLETLSSTQSPSPTSALDAIYLLKLMPLCMSPSELLPPLIPLIQNMLDSRSYSRGKSFLYLFQSSCKLLEMLLKSYVLIASSSTPLSPGISLEGFLEYISPVMNIAYTACNIVVSPAPTSVMGSAITLLLQTIDISEMDCLKSYRPMITEIFGNGINQILMYSNNGMDLPLEISTILFCAASHVYEPLVVSHCESWVHHCRNAIYNSTWTTNSLALITRYTTSLDALARYRSTSPPNVRQQIISHLGNINDNIGDFISALLVQVVARFSNRQAMGQASSNSLLVATSATISLSQSLLQNLGKKHFFQQASTVLLICHSLISGEMGSNLSEDIKKAILFEGSGLDFVHQTLHLAKGIALASSSSGSTANDQVFITHQLLCGVSVALSDTNLCADLLEDILQCGWTSVSCYWQGSSGGTNIQPLVLYLVQVFVGCMHPSVPPHDALISAEGLLNIHENRGLFKLSWFQDQCFDLVIDSCLRVFILGIHSSHHDVIGKLIRGVLISRSILSQQQSPSGTLSFWPMVCNKILSISLEINNNSGDKIESVIGQVTSLIENHMDANDAVDILLTNLLRSVISTLRCLVTL